MMPAKLYDDISCLETNDFVAARFNRKTIRGIDGFSFCEKLQNKCTRTFFSKNEFNENGKSNLDCLKTSTTKILPRLL